MKTIQERIYEIDEVLGTGYAAAHSDVVAAIITAVALDNICDEVSSTALSIESVATRISAHSKMLDFWKCEGK